MLSAPNVTLRIQKSKSNVQFIESLLRLLLILKGEKERAREFVLLHFSYAVCFFYAILLMHCYNCNEYNDWCLSVLVEWMQQFFFQESYEANKLSLHWLVYRGALELAFGEMKSTKYQKSFSIKCKLLLVPFILCRIIYNIHLICLFWREKKRLKSVWYFGNFFPYYFVPTHQIFWMKISLLALDRWRHCV